MSDSSKGLLLSILISLAICIPFNVIAKFSTFGAVIIALAMIFALLIYGFCKME